MRQFGEVLNHKCTPFLFYRQEENSSIKIKLDKQYKISQFKPSLLSLNKHKSRSLIYMIWFIFTLGKYKIYYVNNTKGHIIHIAHVIPKFFKFPFMQEDDLEIGPCWTSESNRGRGIYPAVLQYIFLEESQENRKFFMMISPDNIASIRGVLRAGFKEYGRGFKSQWLGIYNLEKNEKN